MLKKTIIILLVIIIFSCGRNEDDVSSASWVQTDEQALAVNTLTVSKGILIPYVTFTGVVGGKNESIVISETQGIIKSVNFQIGDKVKEGTVLLQVDNSIAALNRDQAAQQYENAMLDLQAIEKYYKQGNASLSELKRSRSALSGSKSLLEQAEKVFADSSLKAPISGYIAERPDSVSRGNYLTPGARVSRIIDTSVFQVKGSVGEKEISMIQKNGSAEIRVLSSGKVYSDAFISAIGAGSNERTGSFPVLVEWKTDDEFLKTGMSVEVKLKTREEMKYPLIPLSAIRERSGKKYVFIEKEGRAAAAEIEIYTRSADRVLIAGGIEEGDELIVSGLTVLRPDYPVKGVNQGRTGGH